MAVILLRWIVAIITVSLTAVAMSLFAAVVLADGIDVMDIVRLTLLAISCGWLSWNAMTAMLGLVWPTPRQAPDRFGLPRLPHGRTAVLIPVYNEDSSRVFANLAAMYVELDRLNVGDRFHFHVLSDSTDPDCVARERQAYLRALCELRAGGRIFYRHRSPNTHRKAGNIADFIRASGGAYDYMLVLDADSLMRGSTMVELARRIEADPELGLLQTVPVIIGRSSLFGRVLQFAAALYSQTFARGVAALQGRHGIYWGHNAIIRTRAFAASCGLPELSGKPPFGGPILSHDFVEAALLARAGWKVQVDPELDGSYEETPANLLVYAKRDRRWCQGNLQHARVLPAPGLPMWSRLMFVQGIMAYAASPVWLLFLAASLLAPLVVPEPIYFPEPGSPFPVLPYSETGKALVLIAGVVGILVLPKALCLLRALATGDCRGFAGRVPATLSALGEILLTSALAPVLMMFQTRAVVEVLSGADAGWPASSREDGSVSLSEAWRATWWIVASGLVWLIVAFAVQPSLVWWILPIVVPLLAAPLLVSWTASPGAGRSAASLALFATPAETEPETVIRLARTFREAWFSSPTAPKDGFPDQRPVRPVASTA